MQFLILLRQAPRQLAFGALHSFGSSFGQTFLVALFVPFISASLALNETEFANIYAGITIASALCLPVVGRWIDKVDILSYSLATMALLALGCVMIALAGNVWMLIAALFVLRLAGQGLMSHVSMTGIARYFSRSRGRALAIASFGFPLAEAIMPATLLALIAAFGWRYTYAGSAAFILLVLLPVAIWLIRSDAKFRKAPTKSTESATAPDTDSQDHAESPTDTRQSDHPRLFKSLYVWFCMPMLAAPPLIMTALFFHQGAISNSKGIELGWFAAGFTVFAITSVLGAFGSGPLIDKHSARRLFPWHLIPMMVGIAILALTTTPWVILIYMGLVGITVGFATTLRTAIIPELVPLDEIGAVRSTLTAVMVLASAIGPAIYGWMFAADMSIATMLVVTLIAAAIVSLGSWFSERPGFYMPPNIAPKEAD
ncbi:MAG: MFS transporter [Thalassospira sp.]|uniref:MFS transporter n=1 Tax=Thalassospira sp. TaxID=1912094 RepID=UPI001B142698|nr:MFS transporter [Thalassospira sp.]MBO6578307.1 MFS transporter [Thalassospira sp.]MBO6802867.1 MFS transporter [Thalassospira sp.]MBO6820414.1 MFS transporter [Thalassospira sp.]MBO6887581.1 MFS transporter [Thalassospira sp.]